MNKLMLSGLVCATLLALPETGFAHGGQYRGPGDVVPPNPGGGGGRTPGPSGPTTPGPSGPTTPGPSGPSTPGPSGPTTGGPVTPAGPAAGPRTPRGGDVGPDLSRWQFWWEFNKDPFINLKDAVHATQTVTGSDEFFMGASKAADTKDTMKPSETEILNTVLPALKRALESTQQRDITSSCMVAMAKIGKDNEAREVKILNLFAPHLKSGDQEIRETAALAMGISAMPAAIDNLIALAKDLPEGRKLCDRSEVDDRTRSFACYSLGLVAYANADVDLKSKAFQALKSVLEDGKISNRNPKVAAINGIRLVRPNPEGSDKEKKLLDECVDTLWGYYEKKLGKGEQLIQAHVPPAIAQLLHRGSGKDRARFKDAFMRDLDLTGDLKLNDDVIRSAAIALGILCDRSKEDEKYVDALIKYSQTGKDQMATYFAMISLSEIGGEKCRNALIERFQKGNKATVKPWSALALGVLNYHAMKEAGQSNATVDTEVGRQLHQGLKEITNPEAKAAIAIALGLMKFTDASDDMRDLLIKNKQQDELAGYLSIGLALMNNKEAMEDIRSIVKTSIRRPDLLKQAAIALGKLGDKSITDVLMEMLTSGDTNVAKLSAVAVAFGYIGDRRTIDPLVKLLFDDKLTDLSRAFSAVALGGVSDKELLPWNSKIACDMNYRAAVETLTNGATGILDIL